MNTKEEAERKIWEFIADNKYPIAVAADGGTTKLRPGLLAIVMTDYAEHVLSQRLEEVEKERDKIKRLESQLNEAVETEQAAKEMLKSLKDIANEHKVKDEIDRILSSVFN